MHSFIHLQNPNEDTEWNDILRSKGILPQKEREVAEADIVNMLEATIEEKQSESEEISVSYFTIHLQKLSLNLQNVIKSIHHTDI